MGTAWVPRGKWFQFVWWPKAPYVFTYHKYIGGMALVYKWTITVGRLEIRRWNNDPGLW